jgi:anti-sigma regulatory factor (Ser/Thr protein kinase)/predicted transcriptional regulator
MSLSQLLSRLLEERGADRSPGGPPEVRVAIYDSRLAEPRVVSISNDDFQLLVGELTANTYDHAQRRGGRIPYVVIREIVENLVHAHFRDAVITILDDGNTIRISDQGPGIRDKDRAIQPGFTTATPAMRQFIRGVGSGLPVVREQLNFLGGAITLEDNLNGGTVVTLRMIAERAQPTPGHAAATAQPELTDRQRRVLLLVAEMGSVGPTSVAKELEISLSTAHRELRTLESLRLHQTRGGGRRTLTEEGVTFVDSVFRRNP